MFGIQNLVDVWSTAQGMIHTAVIQVIIDEAIFMARVHLENNPSLRSTFTRELQLPNVGSRRINQPYQLTKGVLEQIQQDLGIIGGEWAMDNKIRNIPVTNGGPSQWTQQLLMHTKATALLAKKLFLIGEPSNGDPPGVRHWLETELLQQNLLYGGITNTVGKAIDDRETFVNEMNRLMQVTQGVPDFYISNEEIGSNVDALFMVGQNSVLPSLYKWEEVTIRPGLVVLTAHWRGKPWFFAKDDHQAKRILEFNEVNPNGVDFDTTSIFAIKTGAGMFVMEQDQNPEIVGDPGTTSSNMAIDWAITTVPRHPKSIGRLHGILQRS